MKFESNQSLGYYLGHVRQQTQSRSPDDFYFLSISNNTNTTYSSFKIKDQEYKASGHIDCTSWSLICSSMLSSAGNKM